MAAGQWITPTSAAPGTFVTRRLHIPADVDWLAIVFGALVELTKDYNFEQLTGISAEDAAAAFSTMFDTIDEGGALLGTIVPYATASPPAGTLACDGSTHLRIDYPALYAVLATAFIQDADHFVVPDLRGRTVLGIGTGSGLTARAMNDAGGSETHALTTAELASHSHGQRAGSQKMVQSQSSGAVSAGNAQGQTGTTDHQTISDAAGSGTAHENMQPWRALGYAITAL